MAGRLLSNGLFTLHLLSHTASYRGDKALGGHGRSSLMSTSHLDPELETDLEEVGHGLENNRNTAPHQGFKGPKTKQNEQSKYRMM